MYKYCLVNQLRTLDHNDDGRLDLISHVCPASELVEPKKPETNRVRLARVDHPPPLRSSVQGDGEGILDMGKAGVEHGLAAGCPQGATARGSAGHTYMSGPILHYAARLFRMHPSRHTNI